MAEDATVALITTAQAKTLLQISGSTEDTLIDAIVNRCSQMAATYCSRQTFRKKTYTEYYDGVGSDRLMLRNFPVVSLTSLHNADATRTFDASTLVDAGNIQLDRLAGQVRLWNQAGVLLMGNANVKVIYVAGYTIGATGAEIEVPYDLTDAVGLMVMYSYKRHYQDQRIGLKSETIGDRTLTYENEDIPAKAKAILDRYTSLMGVQNFAYAD